MCEVGAILPKDCVEACGEARAILTEACGGAARAILTEACGGEAGGSDTDRGVRRGESDTDPGEAGESDTDPGVRRGESDTDPGVRRGGRERY